MLRPTSEFEELFSCRAGVADQRAQETPTQFPVLRHREPAAGRSNQDHVAAFRAIEGESEPSHDCRELVSGQNREARHGYARTSMISNSDDGGSGTSCSRRLAR